MLSCQRCGGQLPPRARFCPSCAHQVAGDEPAPEERTQVLRGADDAEQTMVLPALAAEPAAPAPPPHSPRPRLLPWAAAMVAVAVVGAGAGLALTRHPAPADSASTRRAAAAPARASGYPTGVSTPGSSASAPAADPAAAAARIGALLDSSASGRTVLVQATDGLARCRLSASTAVAELAGVAQNRSQLLQSVGAVPFASVPRGAELQALLTQAWQASLEADQAFLTWARSMQAAGSCGRDDASYREGVAASARANRAKRAFVALWNSAVARPLDVPRRAAAQI